MGLYAPQSRYDGSGPFWDAYSPTQQRGKMDTVTENGGKDPRGAMKFVPGNCLINEITKTTCNGAVAIHRCLRREMSQVYGVLPEQAAQGTKCAYLHRMHLCMNRTTRAR